MSSPLSNSSRFDSSVDDGSADTVVYAAVERGDAQALGILYNRHAGLVYAIAIKVLANKQAAEDLTQDIFVTLASAKQYNPRRGSLRTYLAVLTRSRAIDRIRSKGAATRKINRLQNLQSRSPTDNVPLEHVSQREQNHTLREALSQLSPEEQQILNMMYFEGLSQSAVSQALGVPLGTVKTRSRRGLIKLRQILGNHNLVDRS